MHNQATEAGAHAAIHNLKSPLSVIIRTSNAIFNITDLTPEELYEYLKQIRSSADKMDEIVNSLLLRSDADQGDAVWRGL